METVKPIISTHYTYYDRKNKSCFKPLKQPFILIVNGLVKFG